VKVLLCPAPEKFNTFNTFNTFTTFHNHGATGGMSPPVTRRWEYRGST
jgi:hypothetical protein